jgi:hypothetical protein
MNALKTRAARKLARICGMFGSEHSGERAAAAALADKIVREHGLDWFQVITATRHYEPLPDSEAEELVRFALDGAEYLNEWERNFLLNIRGRAHLTEKQWDTLQSITRKARGGKRYDH